MLRKLLPELPELAQEHDTAGRPARGAELCQQHPRGGTLPGELSVVGAKHETSRFLQPLEPIAVRGAGEDGLGDLANRRRGLDKGARSAKEDGSLEPVAPPRRLAPRVEDEHVLSGQNLQQAAEVSCRDHDGIRLGTDAGGQSVGLSFTTVGVPCLGE